MVVDRRTQASIYSRSPIGLDRGELKWVISDTRVVHYAYSAPVAVTPLKRSFIKPGPPYPDHLLLFPKRRRA